MRPNIPMILVVLASGSGWSAAASGSDYGCQVLLCLSNPSGPTQYGACVPPITKLWRDLALGKSFPTCTGGGVTKAKVSGKKSSPSYRVTMTFSDGRQQSYSLAGISGASAQPTGSEGSFGGAAPK